VATVMVMHWPGISTAVYQEVREKVGWEEDVPDGARFHVAWQDGDAMRVVDVWDSAEQFERFVRERLMPVVKGQMGVQSEPDVELHEAYAVFDPAAPAAA
jgi:hypothetical protein